MNLLVYEIDPFLTDRSPMPYAFPTNSRWLVGGAQVFRFLAGVKVVPQKLTTDLAVGDVSQRQWE